MTAISLHAAPRWRDIAWEQIRIVGLRLRTAGALLLVMLALFGGIAIQAAQHSREWNLSHAGHESVNFSYTPELSFLFASLAILLPLAMWLEEDPTRRAYHWSMPVSRATHAMTRTFAGWVWLVAVIAVWLAFIVAIDAITQRIVGATLPRPLGALEYLAGGSSPRHATVGAWEYLVPFTAATIAYLFASAAAIGARTPLVWIAGPPLIYAGVSILAFTLGHSELSRAMSTIISGSYGASAAMAGVIRVDAVPSLGRWLGAAALWGGAASMLLYAVSHRRNEAT
jgi:hypothetical protein